MSAEPATGTVTPPAPDGVIETRPAAARRPGRRAAALTAGFALIVATYLIALASPLRMIADGVVYLSDADGIPQPTPHQGYPPGYPLLLRTAERLGLGSASGFVAVNLVLLGLALALVYSLCRQPLGLSATRAAFVCLLVLLVHAVSFQTPQVASEIPALAATMACLRALCTSEQRSGRARAGCIAVAAVLAAIAIAIRLQELALVPLVLYVAIGRTNLARTWRFVRRRRSITLATAVGSAVALAALIVVVVAATPYATLISHAWRLSVGPGAFLGHVAFELRQKLLALGELAAQTNCCQKLPGTFRPPLVVLGVALLAVLVLGGLARRPLDTIEVFVLFSAAVLLVYPGGETRYLISPLPFVIVYALFGLERLARLRFVRLAVVLYAIAFVAIGAGWLANSVIISTSGRRFPSVWGPLVPQRLAVTYRVAFGEARRPRALRLVIPNALELLWRYEPLARHPATRVRATDRTDGSTHAAG